MARSQSDEPEREIRFATVIYGGVSLAIYINGIVQEMLHLVRSTAIDKKSGKPIPWENLKPVERVYRTLSTLVGKPAEDQSTRQTAVAAPNDRPRHSHRPGTAGLCAHAKSQGLASIVNMIDSYLKSGDTVGPHPIRTRFVVDVLCGTSAGGINAIFLAKALVGNLSIESLAQMWILDADLDELLNDKKITPKSLQQNPPQALLNARWMYMELLLALNRMNKAPSAGEPCTLVDDLDLYCTTTDLFGIPISIPLADESVQESRFRNFYHFRRRINDLSNCGTPQTDPRMGKSINDLADTDPFLAFAARCTSSFPFAFEPMRLQHAFDIIQSDPRFSDYLAPKADPDAEELFGANAARLQGARKFQQICSIYNDASSSDDAPARLPFVQRPFGDGGYLDNKPFTYAIETIKKRHAILPVDRKLIYIEPDPDSITAAPVAKGDGITDRPNAVENSLDALVVLPRYETIRQDIESVIEWNANISRLHRVLDHFEQEIEVRAPDDLRHMEDTLAYDSYWRLRLSGTADQLADVIADCLNTDATSAEGQAIRSIVGTWRENHFGRVASRELHKSELRARQQRFLDLFDFGFCERELRFLREHLQRIEDDEKVRKGLFDLATITVKFMAVTNQQPELSLDGPKLKCWDQYLRFIVDPKAASRAMGYPLPGESPTGMPSKPLPDPGFLSVTDAGRDSRVEWLMTSDASVEVLSAEKCECEPGDLVKFSEIVDEMAKGVVEFYADNGVTYNPDPDADPVMPKDGRTRLQLLREEMEPLFQCVKVPEPPEPGMTPISGWEFFRVQDMLMYPMVFGTDLGEFESVEIFRISPQDTRPIAETSPNPKADADANPPLCGDALWAFGGFLDKRWRLNDMLRGRLDGAERLITAILPDSDPHTVSVREHLINAAQEAVATDWEEFAAGVSR
jgi:patatin-related protein